MPKKKIENKVKKKVITEKEGIKMIKFLQKMGGIDEPDEKAKAGWNSMSESEREKTLFYYAMFNK